MGVTGDIKACTSADRDGSASTEKEVDECCKRKRDYTAWLVSVCLLTVCIVLWVKGDRSGMQLRKSRMQFFNPSNVTGQQVFPDWQGNFSSPKVYVYTLPDSLAACEHDRPEAPWNYSNYGAEIMIPTWLKSSQYLTSNPDQADFFYVPTLLYCIPAGGTPHRGTYKDLAAQTLAWLNANSTFWTRKGGKDHIFTFTQDHGFCGFATNEGSIPGMKDSIILSHWGLKANEVWCTWEERLQNFGHCIYREFADKLLQAGTFQPCYRPGKPIMDNWAWNNDLFQDKLVRSVAVHLHGTATMNFSYPQTMLQDLQFLAEQQEIQIDIFNATLAKKQLVFFNGGIRPDDVSYSHGVRQTIYNLFQDHPGFSISDREANNRSSEISFHEVVMEMAQSTFCLALTGAAWGVRLKMSLLAGCIPVVIGDDVEMEFEDVIPYQDFAIRLPSHVIYRLPELLREVLAAPGRVATMQQRLNCAWRHLSYNLQHGTAGETLMCSLRRRFFGTHKIWPAMDWSTCTLLCGGVEDLDHSKLKANPEQLSLADYGQRLKRLQGNLT